MSTPSEKEHLDPDNLMYYAPRRMREEVNAGLPASTDTMRSTFSPSPIDTLLKQAVSKSFRTLDPVAMHEPPANGGGLWRELLPATWRFATAFGVAVLAALLFVITVPASKNQARDSNASGVAEAPKAASDMAKVASDVPNTSSEQPAPRQQDSTPALAEFATVLAASRVAQPTAPAMTHEQSEALFQQFVRWQQKLDSTDAPPR